MDMFIISLNHFKIMVNFVNTRIKDKTMDLYSFLHFGEIYFTMPGVSIGDETVRDLLRDLCISYRVLEQRDVEEGMLESTRERLSYLVHTYALGKDPEETPSIDGLEWITANIPGTW